MGPVRDALDQLLQAHHPCPAVVIDSHWGLVSANDAIALLTDGVAPHLLKPPANVLRLSLHPAGMAPRIVNLAQWRSHLLGRLHRETVISGDPALAALHEELASYPGQTPGPSHAPATADIAVPLRVRVGETELSFISTVTTFGTATDITLSELSIESFFPADATTSDRVQALADTR